MNRLEISKFLESFFPALPLPGEEIKPPQMEALKAFLDIISSLKKTLPLSIPLLRDIAALNKDGSNFQGQICERINRRYLRLCRIQEELGRLDLKKAPPGTRAEDYIFSQIDFSRYRKIDEKTFLSFFLEGLEDFTDVFFKNNFGSDKEKVKTTMEQSFLLQDGVYILKRDNPIILSIMRTLETSPESRQLFSAEEINEEINKLLEFMGGGKFTKQKLLYPLLVNSLDNKIICHEDGMKTKLSVSSNGNLSATFRPGDKPWTMVLITV